MNGCFVVRIDISPKWNRLGGQRVVKIRTHTVSYSSISRGSGVTMTAPPKLGRCEFGVQSKTPAQPLSNAKIVHHALTRSPSSISSFAGGKVDSGGLRILIR